MRDLLPASQGYHELANGHRGGKPVNHRILRDSQGSITGKRLKRVCQRCNNEWMGSQEERAKAIVTRLISATPTMLCKSERQALVDWVIIKLIVLDVFRDDEQAFTDEERSAFRHQRSLPAPLSIWLLRCGEDRWQTSFWSHAQRLTIVRGATWAEAKPPPGAGPNLKLFLWGIGEALIVASYSRNLDIDLEMQDQFAIQLLPDRKFTRYWPPVRISAVDASKLERTLLDLAVSMGGNLIEVDNEDPAGPR